MTTMKSLFSAMMLSTFVMWGLVGPSTAETSIAVENISFEKQDGEATQLVRTMYGKTYSFIKAVRVRLDAPSEDPDAVFAKIGNGPNCERDCENIALFYNTKWLEIYRRPATDNLSLSVVKALGMKSILEDGREWAWNSQVYVPLPDTSLLKARDATEDELIRINEVLGADVNDAKEFGPPTITAYDADVRVGGEKIFTVQSPYWCGQGPCPVFVMDSGGVMIGQFASNDAAVGLSKNIRDRQDYRALEIMTPDGMKLVSIPNNGVLQSIEPQKIVVAGSGE